MCIYTARSGIDLWPPPPTPVRNRHRRAAYIYTAAERVLSNLCTYMYIDNTNAYTKAGLCVYISIYVVYAPSLTSLRRLLMYTHIRAPIIRAAHSKIYRHMHTHTHYYACESRRECMSRVCLCVYIISRVYIYKIYASVYTANLRRHAHRARNSLNQFGGGSCRPHDCCA